MGKVILVTAYINVFLGFKLLGVAEWLFVLYYVWTPCVALAFIRLEVRLQRAWQRRGEFGVIAFWHTLRAKGCGAAICAAWRRTTEAHKVQPNPDNFLATATSACGELSWPESPDGMLLALVDPPPPKAA